MTVGAAGNDTNISPQRYDGVPPKQEQVGQFKAALNHVTTSNDALNRAGRSRDLSQSLPLILANRPPVNFGNQKGQQHTQAATGAAGRAPTATRSLPGTSTPLPKDATVDKNKVATLHSGEFTVKIKPDRPANEKDEVDPNGAVTNFEITWSYKSQMEDGKIVSATVNKVLHIQTAYASTADPGADSAYGRGNTKKDKEAGNSSLRFHEGRHGQDYIDYVKTHPFPTLHIDQPITEEEFEKRMSELTDQYAKDMKAYSKEHTDEVKDPPGATSPSESK